MGESIEGELSAGDIDYFRVTVSSAGRLTVWTTDRTDTYGYIEDSSGNVLDENDDGGEDDNFRVSAAVEPGTYYIRVLGASTSITGPYALTLYLDDDGSPATATPVAVGESIEGELSAGDIDYFRVTVTSAGRLTVWTTGNTDTVFIEDSSGNVLDDDRNSFLVSVAVEPGTYYILVSGYDVSSTGPYTLTLHLDDDRSPATATPVAVGESIEGELSAGDIDYFRVTVTSAGRLTVWTTGNTDTVFIEDSSGNVLDENDDGGEADNFRVSAAVGPGTYYIRVASDSSTGVYTLKIHLSGAIRRLTTDLDFSPSWSPDGQHIAFSSYSRRYGNFELYVMDSDGSNPRRLTNLLLSTQYLDDPPSWSWSPSGRRIAFVAERNGNWDIYVVDTDGTNLHNLTNDSAGDGPPSWSPDGRHIAFVSTRDGNAELYVMDSDGNNPRRLTDHSAWDGSPSWSPDGRHIAFESRRDGNAELYVMDSDGSNPRRLTDHSAWDEYPSWSPDGRHIAFVSTRDGNAELYVMGSDGSNLRRLTDHSARDEYPSWSPDGRHIAFVSTRDRDGNGNEELYVMGSDGSNLRRLTTDIGFSPSWSPDGRHIAFVSGKKGVYVIEFREAGSGGTPLDQMEEVAGAIRRLTNHSADDWSPSWSPDGRHIAFSSERDDNFEIYVMGSDGSNPRRLTNHSAGDGHPSWSPDGRHIAFASWRDGNFEIYVMGSDGSNPRRLTHDSARDFSPSWSPDGRHIAFSSERDDNFEIYVMGSDGSNPRRLTHDSARDFSPSWSPDGRHIAFESDFEIYVMGSDGSNPRRLAHDSARDFSPSWSPDGRHIAFMSYRDGNFEIYVMGSDGSNPRRLTHDSARDGSPSWSPDGRHIAFASERDGNGEIYVMELR